MPASKVPFPPTRSPMVNDKGFLTQVWSAFFDKLYGKVIPELQSTITELQTTVANLQAEIIRNAISSSNTVPTALLTQIDNGTGVTVVMAAHVRYYDDGETATINEASVDVPYETTAGFYYDDEDRSGVDVVIGYSTDTIASRANYVTGRHSLGVITTIAAGVPPPTEPEGGVYAPGIPSWKFETSE